MSGEPIEKLRKVWTPGSEIEEVVAELNPQSELDSQIRDYFHRTIQQRGPVTLLLADQKGQPILNTGNLRWEIIHHEPKPGMLGKREISIWVEN